MKFLTSCEYAEDFSIRDVGIVWIRHTVGLAHGEGNSRERRPNHRQPTRISLEMAQSESLHSSANITQRLTPVDLHNPPIHTHTH